MEQQYIFKKQIISILILILLICSQQIFLNGQYTYVSMLYLFVVSSITFVPSLRKHFNYPLPVHYGLYYLPMILPTFFLKEVQINYSLKYTLYGVILSVVLSLTNYKHTRKIISGSNIMTLMSMEKKEFLMSIYLFFIALISEELFYRQVLISVLKVEIGVYSILASTFVFWHSHYINRWANKMFNIRSYIYHLIVGLSFGALFYYTNSILSVIIGHAIFNSPQLVVNYKRYKRNSIVETSIFDDY